MSDAPPTLPGRYLPVLRLAVAGKRNAEIAGERALAVYTVEKYVSELMASSVHRAGRSWLSIRRRGRSRSDSRNWGGFRVGATRTSAENHGLEQAHRIKSIVGAGLEAGATPAL